MDRSPSVATISKRSLIKRTFARQEGVDEGSEDIKGAFGLNTLCDVGPAALADLVFVHGLGGGSKSTWTRSGDPNLYWPKAWLPYDPDFHDVRIHSFGYNSNWGNESILGVHDFAKSLLSSIHHCPQIPRDAHVCAPRLTLDDRKISSGSLTHIRHRSSPLDIAWADW